MNFRKQKTRMQVLIPMCAFVLAVIIVLILIIPSTKVSDNSAADPIHLQEQSVTEEDPEDLVQSKAETNEVAENKDSSMEEFFGQYYQAMADGDAASVDAMFDAEGYATTSEALSELIEEYKNIIIYTAPGLHEGETAAFVYSDVKFRNIETPAPEVESFYLTQTDDGLRIMSSMYTNAGIAEYLTLLSQKDPVKSIMQNTNFWLQTTLQNDDVLKQVYEQMKEAIENGNGQEQSSAD